MLRNQRDTIFALASGVGRAAIAIVRISGADCSLAIEKLVPGKDLADRRATLRLIRHPDTREALDRCIVVRFRAPHSYTGEEMAELQVTGGRAVVAAVLNALSRLPGFRPADPGEFAWRAFINGRLDLSEVGGLADLVEAETEAQRRQALRVADGALSRECLAIRMHLVDAMAVVEAQLDFSDVEDAEGLGLATVRECAQLAAERLDQALATAKHASRLRNGLTVVIAGPANVGKSTLMNALAGRDVAITSAIPGTTRDTIEVFLDLRGYPVTLVDTAGIRETDDPIEREGVERARRRAASADLILWLEPLGGRPTGPRHRQVETILVRTKIDAARPAAVDEDWLGISAKTGEGVDSLLDAIADVAEEQMSTREPALLSHVRHEFAFRRARRALDAVLDAKHNDAELIAEDLRLAVRALDGVIGRVDVEEVLDGIFARLCVGK